MAFALAGTLAISGCILAVRVERTPARAAQMGPVLTSLAKCHRDAWHLLTGNAAILWANLFDSIAHLTWFTVGGSFYLAFLTTAGFSSSAAGLLISGQLLVATLAQLTLAYWSKHAPILTMAVAATIIGAVTLGITPLLGTVPLIVVVGCMAGVSRIEWPILMGFVAENTDTTERAVAVALLNVTWGLLSPVFLFVLGFLVQGLGLASDFYATGAFVTLSPALLWIWARKRLVSDRSGVAPG